MIENRSIGTLTTKDAGQWWFRSAPPSQFWLLVSMLLALTCCAAAQTSKPFDVAAHEAFDIGELDSSRNPCQDFEGFVNAKWKAAHPIPSDRPIWGAIYQLREDSLNVQRDIAESAARNAAQAKPGSIEQKIGWLYASGMDEAAIEKAGFDPLKPKLARIDALKSTSDVIGHMMGSTTDEDLAVFNFGSYADFKDASMHIAVVFQSGLGLPTRDYYLEDNYQKIRDAYLAYIDKTLELTGVPAADAKQQASQVLALETELAKVSFSPVELRDPKKLYHFVTVAEADQITPHFSWKRFFAAQGVRIDKGFSLSPTKFFAEFDTLLASAPIEQWRAYLRFHAIDDAALYLSKAFEESHFEFYSKTLAGQPQQAPRWKRVLNAINGSDPKTGMNPGNAGMGEALGQLYVARVFTPDTKLRAQVLVNNILAAMKARIEKLNWMSDETKAKALAKWNAILPKIGYPDTWRDWSELEIKPGDYYGNLEAIARFDYHYNTHGLNNIGKPTDRRDWDMTPQTVNAYYDMNNTINFPAAALQPPAFFAESDDAINYGAVGWLIGHEMTHGFDDEGSQFDERGNLANWWTEQDRTKFNARTEKLVQQFNEYAPIAGKLDAHVNGKLTLGENIADLGGFNIAYDALQTALKQNPSEAGAKIDGFTEGQRFFLSGTRVTRTNVRDEMGLLLLNTDFHAPGSLRAVGPFSNMDAFAEAFHCKAGDAMVRTGEKQVKIW